MKKTHLFTYVSGAVRVQFFSIVIGEMTFSRLSAKGWSLSFSSSSDEYSRVFFLP